MRKFAAAGTLILASACSGNEPPAEGDTPPVAEETPDPEATAAAAPGSPPEPTEESQEPADPALLMVQLRYHLYAERVGQAIGVLDQLVQLQPDEPWVHLWLGRCLMMDSLDRDLDEAWACLERAEDLGATAAQVDRGRILVAQDKPDEARELLVRFRDSAAPYVELAGGRTGPPNQNWATAEFILAELALARGDVESLEERLTKVFEVVRAYIGLRKANPVEVQRMKRILTDLRRLRVRVQLAAGDPDGAVEAATKLAASDPGSPKARDLLAEVLAGAGRDQEAAQQTRAAELIRQLDELRPRVHVPLEELEKIGKELDAISPKSPRTEILIARAAMNRNEYERVIELCWAVRSRREGGRQLLSETWVLESEAHQKAGRYRTALQCLEKGRAGLPKFLAQDVERVREVILREMRK